MRLTTAQVRWCWGMGTYLFSVHARSGATIRILVIRILCLVGAVGRSGRLARGKSATPVVVLFRRVHFSTSAMGLAPRFCQMEIFLSQVETYLWVPGK